MSNRQFRIKLLMVKNANKMKIKKKRKRKRKKRILKNNSKKQNFIMILQWLKYHLINYLNNNKKRI